MRIATFLQDLRGGGAERVAVRLANGLVQAGHAVEVLLVRREGPYLADLDAAVPVREIGGGRTLASIPALAGYLRRERPDILLSHLSHVNAAALLAGLLSGRADRVVAVEHNQLSLNAQRKIGLGVRIANGMLGRLYPRAGAVVAVSEGVADDVAKFSGVARSSFHVIYNPVVAPELFSLAGAGTTHPWFEKTEPPPIVAAGRLDPQKDFPTLLRAFARLRRQQETRLVILGEGPERPHLEAMVRELGLEDVVALPGFLMNPYAHFARSALFVLSSRWEGLPTVLIEALACGAPAVATDCPSGPAEILRQGKLGRLVPVGDVAALSAAIAATLDEPDSEPARAARRERALDFTTDKATGTYLSLFAELEAARSNR